MPFEIKILNAETESDYDQLLQHSPMAMFNHSLNNRKFLKQILSNATDYYLLAYENGVLSAALPIFIKFGPLGAVANSLPFYGSHGGIIARSIASDLALTGLLSAFSNLCKEQKAICSTIIESPINNRKDVYSTLQTDFLDERIGQITKLPEKESGLKVEDQLLNLYHQKTRNIVRKGMKAGFIVSHDGSKETFEKLYEMHKENLRSIGGNAKTWSVFEAIRSLFQYDKDYRIYTASFGDNIVCALLIFYFKDTVEYFTPATLEEFRSFQPLSLLIFTAMRDAIIERNSKSWNWGGTWLSQNGVYQFKSRWGTIDYPYRYRIQTYQKIEFFRSMSPADLLTSNPYFYTLPFSALEKE